MHETPLYPLHTHTHIRIPLFNFSSHKVQGHCASVRDAEFILIPVSISHRQATVTHRLRLTHSRGQVTHIAARLSLTAHELHFPSLCVFECIWMWCTVKVKCSSENCKSFPFVSCVYDLLNIVCYLRGVLRLSLRCVHLFMVVAV